MKGFTLIEVIVYLALYAILIGGSVGAAYGLMRAGREDSDRAAAASEAVFVAAKLQWALMNLSAMPRVEGAGCAQEIKIIKTGYDKNPIDIRRQGDALEMSEGGGAFLPLNTSRAPTACLQFQAISFGSSDPLGVRVQTALGNETIAADGYVGL